ncbi:MAG: CRISPR system precrRNA processing endoribonuclease RAMP protein Cas6 [Nitrospirae bacterium]|nr:MAG: CRISPR system precrRNA processing endoribonuclease RAMP protein Cas6 [Nitrospirota bacterium]
MNERVYGDRTMPFQPGDAPSVSLPFAYGRYVFRLVAEAPLPLPPFSGSLFRRAFGWALQHVICVTRTYECPPCSVRERCLFPQVFDTAPPPDAQVMRKYRTIPHPFVLEPPEMGARTIPPHHPFDMGLTLFGNVTTFLPYFLFALERMGRQGLGRGRIRCQVVNVEAVEREAHWLVYAPGDPCPKPAHGFVEHLPVHLSVGSGVDEPMSRVTVQFLTPARIRYQGELTKSLPFHVLVRPLLRRVALLSYFHCEGPDGGVPFQDLIALAERVQTVTAELRWFDWERYSSRQRSRMALGGWLGEVTYEGPLGPFVPLLRAGEICHVGKGTSFGLGRYRLILA